MSDAETTIHVRGAIGGDREAQDWVARRFEPLLRWHARQRVGSGSAGEAMVDDVVQEVWQRALPKLGSIEPRDGRLTPVLVRFLCRTLVNVCFEHTKKMRRAAGEVQGVSETPASSTTPVSEVGRREEISAVEAELNRLEDVDRTIVTYRLLEGASNAQTAAAVDLSEGSVSRRFQAALGTLRLRLKGTVFDDL